MAEEENEGQAEKGTDLFEEVFGEDNEKKPEEGQPEEEEENSEKEQPDKGQEEAEEWMEGEKKSEEEKKPKKRAKKPKIKVVAPIDDGKKKELREKIKKIVVAKAEKAAEEEEKAPLDKELGIKEEGIKEEAGKEQKEKPADKKQEQATPAPSIKPGLDFLQHEENMVFIGRKKSVYKKYGSLGGLFIGEVAEEDAKGKRVYLDSLNPHVVFVCGARGSGKCLHGDTLIPLSNGCVLPIKELENVNSKVLALDHDLKVKEIEKIAFFKRKVNKLLHIKLRSGREIKLTPEHPLLTVNGWRPAEELRKGSRIATPRTLKAFGKTRMKECDVKLLAYLLAEGHLGNQFVLFSNGDSQIIQDFKNAVFEFDCGLEVKQHSKSGCFRVVQKKKKIDTNHIVRNKKGQFTGDSFVISQKSSLLRFIESIGLYNKLSKEKFIPKEIMQLEKEQLALFLNRMFSCDGSIYRISRSKSWGICYASSSEKMARQIQHLLLRFGIISTLREKKMKIEGKPFDSFEVVLYGENVVKFISEIGFFGAKELKQKEAFQEASDLNRNPNIDTIPKEMWDSYRPKNWKATARVLGYAPKSFHNAINYAPSREKLLKISLVDENKGVQLLAQSDIFWDEIASIRELIGETEVYDIEIPKVHNFVASDIIVHNSYIMGVIAEELAMHNKNVGIIVIDPVGVFWSMRFPNRDERELQLLAKWNLLPQGLENVKVFIPLGMEGQIPKNTYDATFSIPPALLTTDDWCLTFGIERFSPSGLLLEKALYKVREGYKKSDGKNAKGKKDLFSLDELIECLRTDSELNSSDKGYKPDSIRALVSRFEAAKNWGIFSETGTPLAELSMENQLTIIDTSFLEDNVSALVIGLLARRILAARKISTRRESAQRFKEERDIDKLLEYGIPPTWLFIDEAHTLIPSGNVVSPASNALVEYVKQGRQPGCSIVFATQQPSAINSKVLSQLDLMISHKLVFDDDIKAVYKRTPTIIPRPYKKSSFIKTLPVGVALTGDRREETTRAFILKVRPRMSQHEGREAETAERQKQLGNEEVLVLAAEMANNKLQRAGELETSVVDQMVKTLNSKYNAKVKLGEVLSKLEENGVEIDEESSMLRMPGLEKEEEEEEEPIGEAEQEVEEEAKSILPAEELELLAFPARLDEERARALFNSMRKKKFLGILGEEEGIESIQLRYMPVYRVELHAFNSKQTFHRAEAYINSISGELLHFLPNKGEFIESRGLQQLNNLSEKESKILLSLDKKKEFDAIVQQVQEEEAIVKRGLKKLLEKGFVGKEEAAGSSFYYLAKDIDLPTNALHPLLPSLNKLPVENVSAISLMREAIDRNSLPKVLKKLWQNTIVKRIDVVYLPVYESFLKKKDGTVRKMFVEAVNGKKIKLG